MLSLGAINKLTDEYVYPKIANKTDEYKCYECNKDLILCQGDIRVHHFRHKVDSVNPCNHYSKPTESQIHKDAKYLIKTILERKVQISLIRNCSCCRKNDIYEIPEMTETSAIQLEYRFEYNGVKIADVAYIDNGELVCIFEICNTHKTCSQNRPEPWFEIHAETLIKIANDNILTTLQIPCIRCEKCEDCIEKEKNDLILEVKNRNEMKLKKLQTEYEEEKKKSNDFHNHDYWGRSYDGDERIYTISKCIKNIQDEIEIEFIKNSMKYSNNNDEYFTIIHNFTKETIIIHSKKEFEYCNKVYKLIWRDLIGWYNDSYKFNTIECCIKSTNLINELTTIIEKRDKNSIISLLDKLDKNGVLCKAGYGYNFSFRKYIPSELFLECEFIENQIDYTTQYTTGSNIYKIKLPDKNEYIKYSPATGKIYMNKKWQKNIKLDDLLYHQDKIKLYARIWEKMQKKSFEIAGTN